MNFPSIYPSVLFLTCLLAGAVQAQVQVDGAWARATVQGQKGTGAFMKLTARENLQLVRATSPAADVTEVHAMRLEGDILRMHPIASLDLPAGKAVELRPGSYHVMLLDLKAPLARDSTVPLTLFFKNAQGVESKMELQLPVAATAPGAGMPGMDHAHPKH
jgi:periplasmic copper chaperone A